MKLLISGGAGYIGSHMVRYAQEHGHEVVVLDEFSTGHDWAAKDFEILRVNLLDQDKLALLLKGRDFDGVIVAHKDSVQDTKVIVEQLKHENRNEWELNREVYRPWGKYDSIDSDDGYQVKRLTVNPGAKLNVQMHYQRSEHWVIVAGRARVHYGDKSHDLSVNESTYHGKEVVHALENPDDTPLELIEVQVESYLGEDDIVRFKDNYGRVTG